MRDIKTLILKIIKQIKHITEPGDIQEAGFSEVREHRVTRIVTVQLSHLLGPLFKRSEV